MPLAPSACRQASSSPRPGQRQRNRLAVLRLARVGAHWVTRYFSSMGTSFWNSAGPGYRPKLRLDKANSTVKNMPPAGRAEGPHPKGGPGSRGMGNGLLAIANNNHTLPHRPALCQHPGGQRRKKSRPCAMQGPRGCLDRKSETIRKARTVRCAAGPPRSVPGTLSFGHPARRCRFGCPGRLCRSPGPCGCGPPGRTVPAGRSGWG